MPNLLFHFNRFDITASQREQRLVFLEELPNDIESISIELKELNLLVGRLKKVHNEVWKKYFILRDLNATPKKKGVAKSELRVAQREWFAAWNKRKQLEEELNILTAPPCPLHR